MHLLAPDAELLEHRVPALLRPPRRRDRPTVGVAEEVGVGCAARRVPSLRARTPNEVSPVELLAEASSMPSIGRFDAWLDHIDAEHPPFSGKPRGVRSVQSLAVANGSTGSKVR
jgi:hypothetical protein